MSQPPNKFSSAIPTAADALALRQGEQKRRDENIKRQKYRANYNNGTLLENDVDNVCSNCLTDLDSLLLIKKNSPDYKNRFLAFTVNRFLIRLCNSLDYFIDTNKHYSHLFKKYSRLIEIAKEVKKYRNLAVHDMLYVDDKSRIDFIYSNFNSFRLSELRQIIHHFNLNYNHKNLVTEKRGWHDDDRQATISDCIKSLNMVIGQHELLLYFLNGVKRDSDKTYLERIRDQIVKNILVETKKKRDPQTTLNSEYSEINRHFSMSDVAEFVDYYAIEDMIFNIMQGFKDFENYIEKLSYSEKQTLLNEKEKFLGSIKNDEFASVMSRIGVVRNILAHSLSPELPMLKREEEAPLEVDNRLDILILGLCQQPTLFKDFNDYLQKKYAIKDQDQASSTQSNSSNTHYANRLNNINQAFHFSQSSGHQIDRPENPMQINQSNSSAAVIPPTATGHILHGYHAKSNNASAPKSKTDAASKALKPNDQLSPMDESDSKPKKPETGM